MPGKLLLVASPIGNLGDVSERARAALAEADLVACEDTRRSGLLLARLGLSKRLVSMHDHNERQRLPALLAALDEGKTVAVLVGDLDGAGGVGAAAPSQVSTSRSVSEPRNLDQTGEMTRR